MGELDKGSKDTIEQLTHELNTMLAKQLPEAQAQINQSFAARDVMGLRSHLHKLQGACAYCELPELFAETKTLSMMIKSTGFNDLPALQKLLDSVNQEIDKALADLAAKGYTPS